MIRNAQRIGGAGVPRPIKPRWVEFVPSVTYFKPVGVPMAELDEVTLGVDEVEAIRLKDYVGLDQEECAMRMNLAQSTFQRILTGARTKVASALVDGKALRIEGGNYLVPRLPSSVGTAITNGDIAARASKVWHAQNAAV